MSQNDAWHRSSGSGLGRGGLGSVSQPTMFNFSSRNEGFVEPGDEENNDLRPKTEKMMGQRAQGNAAGITGSESRGSRNTMFGLGWGGRSANTEMDDGWNDGWAPSRKRQRTSPQPTIAEPAQKSKPGTSGAKMTFAQKQMAKMGWKQGEGLGADGKGRLNPIEVVQRPVGAGVGMVKEKTKQAKEEEKRAAAFRGEVIEDSSDEERKRKKAAKAARRTNESGRNRNLPPQSRRTKYVTVDELKADLEGSNVPRSLLEFAIDLTGKKVSSHSDTFVTAQPTETESEKAAKKIQRELLSCAESKHGLNEQRATYDDFQSHVSSNIDDLRQKITATEALLHDIKELQELRPSTGEADQLVQWETIMSKLEAYKAGYGDLRGDVDFQQFAVAAVLPLFRKCMDQWEPLSNPKYLVSFIYRLKALLNGQDLSVAEIGDGERISTSIPLQSRRSADMYGTMMHTVWLRQARVALEDDFNAMRPSAAVRLVRTWRPLLPEFVWDHLINQCIVPRIAKALKNWGPTQRRDRDLPNPDAWIFPWLEFLPDAHLDVHQRGLMGSMEKKLEKLLRKHPLEQGIPAYLPPWKEFLGSFFSTMVTRYLLPGLSNHLATHFVIDPADQQTEPLDTVLSYAPLFSTDTMARLLAAEFFPKFHTTLFHWLTMPSADYDEVTEWWGWWKSQIPEEIREHPILEPQWTRALTMIGRALDLGSRASKELSPPPAMHIEAPIPHTVESKTSIPPDAEPKGAATNGESNNEYTFKDVVLSWCETHDLLALPTREAHAGTGEPILRITANFDQRGGVLAYIRGDVLYVRDRKDHSIWSPMELGDELDRLTRTR